MTYAEKIATLEMNEAEVKVSLIGVPKDTFSGYYYPVTFKKEDGSLLFAILKGNSYTFKQVKNNDQKDIKISYHIKEDDGSSMAYEPDEINYVTIVK